MERILACGLLLIAATGCGPRPQARQSPAGGAMLPGIHELTLETRAGAVDYTIVVPDGYRSETPAPLIVALHYGGEVTPFYGRGVIESLVAPGLSELEAIVVAPDSLGGDWTTGDNEQAVLELFEAVAAAYNIDRSKTLLTGFSMGGKGVWHLGSRHQDLFRAAIPIAGSPGASAPSDWRIPLYVINSDEDEVMPLAVTERHVGILKSQGADVHLEVVTGISHYQTHKFAGPLRQAVPWVRRAWQRD